MINERLFQQVCAEIEQAGQRISQREFARAVVGRYLEQMNDALADVRFGTESVWYHLLDDKDAGLIALSDEAVGDRD